MEGSAEDVAPPTLLERRVASVLEVARLHGTGVEPAELASLLPPDGPRNGPELAQWLAAHPGVGELQAGRAVRPGVAPEPAVLNARRARGILYHDEAHRLFRESLGPVAGLVRTAGITGSAAYLEPEAGDDLDLMVVTRAGSVWLFLAYAFLAVRFRVRHGPAAAPPPCLNYVLDDAEAAREFATPRGFLFAREALTLRPLRGEPYYRELLGSAPWISEELPRLSQRWGIRPSGRSPAAAPAPWPVRVANLLAFPWLAAYLQLVGLRRNRHAGRSAGGTFRTVTRFRRLSYESRRFDELDELYRTAKSPHPARRNEARS